MIHFRSNFAPLRLMAGLLVGSALVLAATSIKAETIQADASALIAVDALKTEWQSAADDLTAARIALQDQTAIQSKVESDIAAQSERIEEVKTKLNAAVLTVAEAKNRLAKVDVTVEDVKGNELSQLRRTAETTLNNIIINATQAEGEIAEYSAELERARATVEEMNKAVSAAKAAASAANLVVDAVKSAQQTIAQNESSTQTAGSGLDSDFLNEAMQQAEATQKSAEVAQKALTLTMEREKIIADNLKSAELRLATAQEQEKSATAAFAAADKAWTKHAEAWAAQEEKRKAEVASISEELTEAQEKLAAQTSDFEKETLALQDLSASAASARSETDKRTRAVSLARDVYIAIDADLRLAQRTRSMQEAAILADLNIGLMSALREATPMPANVGASVSIPAGLIFKAKSAKLVPGEGIDIAAIADLAKEAAQGVPEGINWMLRIDNHAKGTGAESWFLSQARALSLAQAIVKQTGLPVERVSANGLAGAEGDGYVEIKLTTR